MSELPSNQRFDQRVAVITGAGRGLGRAYALLLAANGARVVVNDPGVSITGETVQYLPSSGPSDHLLPQPGEGSLVRPKAAGPGMGVDAGPAEQVVQEIKAAGGEAVACTESVATPAGGKAIIQSALDHYGRIDILIHNAGNVRYGSLKELSYEDFEAVLDVHLRGAFHVVRPAFPVMCNAGYGRIVLTSSIGGLYGNQSVANYGVAKAAMIGLCNVAALEGAAEGVKCNIIVPGAVTRMADGIDVSAFPPMGPELVAPVVGWLAHESCSITGEMLISIAGRVAKAFIAETPGAYAPVWTIEQVGKHMDAIRNTNEPWIFPVVPSGHVDHIRRSFEMAARGAIK